MRIISPISIKCTVYANTIFDPTDVILHNFLKAFNKSPHKYIFIEAGLLLGLTQEMLSSFLLGHTQQVLMKGIRKGSCMGDDVSGVPYKYLLGVAKKEAGKHFLGWPQK